MSQFQSHIIKQHIQMDHSREVIQINPTFYLQIIINTNKKLKKMDFHVFEVIYKSITIKHKSKQKDTKSHQTNYNRNLYIFRFAKRKWTTQSPISKTQ